MYSSSAPTEGLLSQQGIFQQDSKSYLNKLFGTGLLIFCGTSSKTDKNIVNRNIPYNFLFVIRKTKWILKTACTTIHFYMVRKESPKTLLNENYHQISRELSKKFNCDYKDQLTRYHTSSSQRQTSCCMSRQSRTPGTRMRGGVCLPYPTISQA